MARETAAENSKALEILTLRPSDRVLEIGFGHGRTIAKAADAAYEGFVAGVDVSERMVRMARRYNRKVISTGRVELTCGSGEALPYADRSFDKVYSIHAVYFWARPLDVLKEIHRVLKLDGLLLLGFRPDSEKARAEMPATVYKFCSHEAMEGMLNAAAFSQADLLDCDFWGRRILFMTTRRSDGTKELKE